MTNRRRYAAPPDLERRSRLGWKLIALPIVAALIVLYAWLREAPVRAFDQPYHRIEHRCTEYAANVPGDTGISEWCMRKRGY